MTNQTNYKQTEIGEIPEDWNTALLSEISSYINRGVPPKYTEVSNAVVVFNQRCIRDGILSLDNARKTDSNLKKIPSEKYLKYQDIVINSTGMGTLGRVAQNTFENLTATVDSHVTIVRPIKTEINPPYLYYFLRNIEYVIENMGIGSTGQKELNREAVKSITVHHPQLHEQQEIASILSSLDNKIELNHRMNKTLEEIGKALFKQWFVDFEFPNENGEPYKSSGGEMVESELGKIPKGWKVKTLPEVADIQKGLSYKGKDLSDLSDTALVGLKCIERGGGFRKDGFKFYDGTYKEEHIIKPGDLIVAMTDLTQAADVIGKPAIVPIIPKIETLVASLDLSIIKPKKDGFDEYYLYLLLSRQESQDFLYGYTNGSTVLHLSIKGLKEFKLLLPEESILFEFQKILQPIRKKLKSLDAETSYLPLLRDSLLPRLMSGKIRV